MMGFIKILVPYIWFLKENGAPLPLSRTLRCLWLAFDNCESKALFYILPLTGTIWRRLLRTT